MPALHLDELLSALASQAIQPDSALSIAPSNATNATRLATSPLQVVCAWPVSGQYGPGSRVLYYFLVAACILARKAEWLRNACLAAALLLPAVAALHGVALAALHDNGAVDMDIYGAFQLCSIAVLTAPVVVRLSRTYFYDPGRNIIFLWTTFLLAGLLSLTVEFYRTNPVECRVDANGNPLTPQDEFPWGVNGTCNITCDTNNGPFSYMRGGAQNNLYVVPVPNVLTFGTATLLCAACCIPSILSLIFMWEKIREINWKRHFAREQDSDDKPIEGTNGATPATMNSINRVIKGFIGAVEAPVFGVAVFAILISGEINFFTVQVNYETEPMASVGQWAPIVGTGLAAIGSLYIWLAAQVDGQGTEEKKLPAHHCNCSHHQDDEVRLSRLERHLGLKDPAETMPRSPEADEEPSDVQHAEIHQIVSTTTARDSNTLAPMMSQATQPQLADGGRRRVARWLTSFANYVGTAAQDRFNNGEFQHGKATNFPEIPGEALRNHRLVQIRTQYNAHPDDDDSMPGLYRSRSRAHSFVSNASGLDDDAARTPRRTSPMRSSPPDPPSPTSLRIRTGIAHRRSTDPVSPSVDTVPALARRRDTLEVPPTVHHRDSHLSPHQ